MSQAISVSPKTMEEIITRLDRLTKEVKAIKAKLFEEEPPYGSDEWWEKEVNEGLEKTKQGKYAVYKNVETLIRNLHEDK